MHRAVVPFIVLGPCIVPSCRACAVHGGVVVDACVPCIVRGVASCPCIVHGPFAVARVCDACRASWPAASCPCAVRRRRGVHRAHTLPVSMPASCRCIVRSPCIMPVYACPCRSWRRGGPVHRSCGSFMARASCRCAVHSGVNDRRRAEVRRSWPCVVPSSCRCIVHGRVSCHASIMARAPCPCIVHDGVMVVHRAIVPCNTSWCGVVAMRRACPCRWMRSWCTRHMEPIATSPIISHQLNPFFFLNFV
ncbi:hypothetical protein NL676_007051 [Syzygium grande]|nr:hypothetical protein NL676_007051 [Syzygium grande]